MKTLGLVGGTSWVSTAEYYRLLNQKLNERLGGHQYARCIIHSLNFGEVIALQEAGDSDGVFKLLLDAAIGLERSGAQGILLCANTMHQHAAVIQARISIPLLHIASATAEAIAAKKLLTVALLGTRPTMEMDFFKEKLAEREIAAVIPNEEDRTFIHGSIFSELAKGIFTRETREHYQRIISSLAAQGVQGVILGCTEIPMLIKQEDIGIPAFDTTAIHVDAAVDFALD